MHRFARTGVLASVAVLLIGGIIAALSSHSGKTADDGLKYPPCPAGAPEACNNSLAQAWHVDAHSLPVIGVPTGLRYQRGFIAKQAQPVAGFFVFDVPLGAQTVEVTVTVVPASSAPFDEKHRGGKLQHLPDGRAYLDRTVALRSGPFLERVGSFDVVVAGDIRKPAGALRAPQLQLLASVANPNS